MSVLRIIAGAAIVVLVVWAPSAASAPVGFYGIIERVVFEPSAESPERVQVWGVFAFAEGRPGSTGMSRAERGYLYFRLPDYATTPSAIELVRREWADLAAVANTGQAVAFGRWAYWGPFTDLEPGKASEGQFSQRMTGSGALTVRPASAPPASPVMYQTNAGIVKLSERGSHAAIVAQLREHLPAAGGKVSKR